jgi:hypothetical protein
MGSPPAFLRFFPAVLPVVLPVLLPVVLPVVLPAGLALPDTLGSTTSLPLPLPFGSGGGGDGGGEGLRSCGGVLGRRGGGEHDGNERAGEKEVMSREGDRVRVRPLRGEDVELGEGESSGAGGRTKWNVREAIWICDLTCLSVIEHTNYVDK